MISSKYFLKTYRKCLYVDSQLHCYGLFEVKGKMCAVSDFLITSLIIIMISGIVCISKKILPFFGRFCKSLRTLRAGILANFWPDGCRACVVCVTHLPLGIIVPCGDPQPHFLSVEFCPQTPRTLKKMYFTCKLTLLAAWACRSTVLIYATALQRLYVGASAWPSSVSSMTRSVLLRQGGRFELNLHSVSCRERKRHSWHPWFFCTCSPLLPQIVINTTISYLWATFLVDQIHIVPYALLNKITQELMILVNQLWLEYKNYGIKLIGLSTTVVVKFVYLGLFWTSGPGWHFS